MWSIILCIHIDNASSQISRKNAVCLCWFSPIDNFKVNHNPNCAVLSSIKSWWQISDIGTAFLCIQKHFIWSILLLISSHTQKKFRFCVFFFFFFFLQSILISRFKVGHISQEHSSHMLLHYVSLNASTIGCCDIQ